MAGKEIGEEDEDQMGNRREIGDLAVKKYSKKMKRRVSNGKFLGFKWNKRS